MLAYANAEALAATLATGEVHFHSRSRGRLWRKGETSGNIAAPARPRPRLRRRRAPRARRAGRARPATAGTRSCFDPDADARRPSRLAARRLRQAASPPAAGLRLAGDALGDDRRPGRDATGRLVHGAPARRRAWTARPQGRRGGDRGPDGRQGRRRRRGRRAGTGRHPRRAGRRGRRPRSTTRWSCWPSAGCRRRRSSRASGRATAADPGGATPRRGRASRAHGSSWWARQRASYVSRRGVGVSEARPPHDHDRLVGAGGPPVDQALRPRRLVAADRADRRERRDPVGDRHQLRHRPERAAAEVRVQPGEDHRPPGVRQPLDDRDEAVREELRLLDRDHVRPGVLGERLDLGRVADRPRAEGGAGPAADDLRLGPVVDRGRTRRIRRRAISARRRRRSSSSVFPLNMQPAITWMWPRGTSITPSPARARAPAGRACLAGPAGSGRRGGRRR